MLPLLARLLLICGLVLPGAARAVDGVVEISQASVAAGGGFPFLISAEGSYVLTSNLVVTDPNLDAIQISSDYVTLDLNGFHISGPVTCSGPPGSISCSAGLGVGIGSTGRAVDIRNGAVSGFGAGGLALADESRVSTLHVAANGATGIVVGAMSNVAETWVLDNAGDGVVTGADSLVVGTTSSFNNGIGLVLGAGSGFSDSVLNQNAAPTSGGASFNGNLCDGIPCTVCAPQPEICDTLDNDGDGVVDNGRLSRGFREHPILSAAAASRGRGSGLGQALASAVCDAAAGSFDRAIANARRAERKTILDRDFD